MTCSITPWAQLQAQTLHMHLCMVNKEWSLTIWWIVGLILSDTGDATAGCGVPIHLLAII